MILKGNPSEISHQTFFFLERGPVHTSSNIWDDNIYETCFYTFHYFPHKISYGYEDVRGKVLGTPRTYPLVLCVFMLLSEGDYIRTI